jgi:hypothetical protein
MAGTLAKDAIQPKPEEQRDKGEDHDSGQRTAFLVLSGPKVRDAIDT